MGGGGLTVIVDAVADMPVISDLAWAYGRDAATGDNYTASDSPNVVLSFTVDFPDTGVNGVSSEGQYILIQKNTDMDLDPAFKQAVAEAGYTIENYVLADYPGQTYYRIPAAYFNAAPGTHTYDVSIPMVMSNPVSEGTFNPNFNVFAQSAVETLHGAEKDTTNNVAEAEIGVPQLDFALVQTTVTGGQSVAYEDDSPDAYLGIYGTGGGVAFGLNVNIGTSPAGDGFEELSPITFTYDAAHGTLYYENGEDSDDWVPVASGGAVPAEYAGNLKYVPVNTQNAIPPGQNGLGDKDQNLNFTLTVTDPASGATRTINGTHKVIMDAVADKPVGVSTSDPDYSNSNGMISYGENVKFTISATFPDFDKSGNNHSNYYILVQQPGSEWTCQNPNAEVYIHDGESYFRIPVDPSSFGNAGSISLQVSLTAPPQGYLLYDNAAPLKLYALSVARDPNLNALLPGDQEDTYGNNWAYSDAGSLKLNYDNSNPSLLYIDPLYVRRGRTA